MTSIQKIATKFPKAESVNILYRLQALVCKINSQLSILSQETQSRSQTMKKEYRVATDKSANLTKKVGSWSPCISGATLVTAFFGNMIVSKYATAKPYEGMIGKTPDLMKGIGDLITSGLNAENAQANSIMQLRQTEISNEAQKSGEARDLQSELQQLLGNLRELFKKAAG
ncbi:MAG TPA: hypothetical protein VLE96_04000 [Chlamydiales bacterium]|nr:hypothetical protein [Chlamydiales bacterium]